MTGNQSFAVRHADLIFTLKTFTAAMLALVIALWIDLPRPYWAMATVYITSQPLAGATSSKALYRVLGTITGAAASIAIIPVFVDAPELLCLVIALWVGLCLYLSLLDGTPRSYAFMLAGYTVALIGFPVVSTPGNIFDDAVARVEEISLGIICASFVSTTIVPRSVGVVVANRVEAWLTTARGVAHDVLRGHGDAEARRDHRLRLAKEAVEIDALETHLSHDRLTDPDTARGLRLLRRHMLMLLPILASINESLAAFGDRLDSEYPNLSRLMNEIALWIDNPGNRTARDMKAAVDAYRINLAPESLWHRAMVASLLTRLNELIEVSRDCRMLSRAIAAGRNPSRINLMFKSDAGAAPAYHRDYAMALWSSAGVVIAILLCCAIWIGTGWPDGSSAPMMAAVACSFYAAQDDPAVGIRGFGIWSVLSVVIVGIYLFALLPLTSNVEVLIAMLAPTFLSIGLLIARPATTGGGMVLGANTATLLALQQTYGADFTTFINSSIAFLLGIAFAVIVTKTARSASSEWIARRLLRTGWNDLALAAERRGKHDRAAYIGIALNRLGKLAQRITAISESGRRDVDSLSQLRIGLNIIDLRSARARLAPRALHALDHMFDVLAAALRNHGGGTMPPALLTSIDTALTEAVRDSSSAATEDALIGLIGVRQGLFPDVPPYTPPPLAPERLAA